MSSGATAASLDGGTLIAAAHASCSSAIRALSYDWLEIHCISVTYFGHMTSPVSNQSGGSQPSQPQ